MKTTGLGVRGEDIAVRYLSEKGYIIHKRNFTSRFGEIDIIAEKDGFICFTEVKTRGENRIASGREAITASKRQKLTKTAEYFLVCNANSADLCGLQPRFDCIEIYVSKNDKFTEINHLENIF